MQELKRHMDDLFRRGAIPFLYGNLLNPLRRKPGQARVRGKVRHHAQAHEARHLWASGAGPRFPEDRHG